MQALYPFLILLIVAVIFTYIPMEQKLKQVGYIIVAIAAIMLLLNFVM